MQRRTLLTALGSGIAVGLSGCTGTFGSDGGSGENTYLDAKEWERVDDPSNLPFPTHGDTLPSVTVPAPLRDGQQVSVPADFETDLLLTFAFTTCNTMCPRLTSILAQTQDFAREEGFGDQVSFVETTFDPARDNANAFRQWADKHRIEMDNGNWYFLRPKDEDRAKEVVQEQYGVHFSKTNPENMDSYMFTHTGLILLANKKGYVERAYKLQAQQSSESPRVSRQDVTDDLATLRERES
ncbi:SCO family protein (plasmid) [Natrinema zhouii]|uniref:SCO family protein n=1 Tax=Natrinema zhouii TaxID=1710539 RepID=UPI001CFFB981|nr:SCO family protein [Natrinema zhouii]UHQ98165.1 SCO family protein [Natrinema zhouii]